MNRESTAAITSTEVLSSTREETYTRGILDRVEANEAISQRSIARELGIALGLANLLLRRMANKGLIRLVRTRPNRVLYFITPTGIAEKARMTVAYLGRNVQLYRDTRDQIRARFAAISRDWAALGAVDKPVIFYGAEEEAEIGFVCLQDSDLRLVGVVDETGGRAFFGLPVCTPADVNGLTLAGQPFEAVVVMSLEPEPERIAMLQQRGIPADRIFRLL